MTKKVSIAKAGIIGLSMFLLFKIISKGAAVSGLNFKISKIAYTISGSGLILTFFVVANNVSAEKIFVNSLEGDIYFNEKQIGTVSNELNISIAGKAETTLPIAVNLFYSPVADAVLTFIRDGNKGNANFRIEGKVKIEGIQFPVNLKYSLL
jgi:LEA14-like dessication related protein